MLLVLIELLEMISLNNYQQIILDFDGTIVDSNEIKKDAIINAIEPFGTNDEKEEFVNYFIYNNGMPREEKVSKFFKQSTTNEILVRYNSLLKKSKNASLSLGFEEFLFSIKKSIPLIILSGGQKDEIYNILKYHEILLYFNKIYTAPKNKYDNIKSMKLEGKSLYIGDSVIDYEVSKTINCDFIFMYRYTQFNEWKSFFRNKADVYIIQDFKELFWEMKC